MMARLSLLCAASFLCLLVFCVLVSEAKRSGPTVCISGCRNGETCLSRENRRPFIHVCRKDLGGQYFLNSEENEKCCQKMKLFGITPGFSWNNTHTQDKCERDPTQSERLEFCDALGGTATCSNGNWFCALPLPSTSASLQASTSSSIAASIMASVTASFSASVAITSSFTPSYSVSITGTNTTTPPSCIEVNQIVTVQDQTTFQNSTILLGDLKVGDYVLSDSGFTQVIKQPHPTPIPSRTIIFTIDNGKTIEVSGNHLMFSNDEFVEAILVNVGDTFYTYGGYPHKVISIAKGNAYVQNPETAENNIVVNDIILSSHTTYHVRSASYSLPVIQ